MPRSLAPLEDESLVGYVLRLAHRLGASPHEIAARTDLLARTPKGVLSVFTHRFLHTLAPRQAQALAQAARLTPAEVQGLLLAPFGLRYGPLDGTLTKTRDPNSVAVNNRWVYFGRSRYCPQCLAGDASGIQQLHGGSWRRLWRLPVTFICLKHRCLLRTRCPACGQPAQATLHPGNLLARPAEVDLHPLQCRSPQVPGNPQSPVCGARFDRARSSPDQAPDPQTLHALLQLQQRLTNLLVAEGHDTTLSVGWSIPTGHYFMDLRALAPLILLTWPESRHLAATPALARTVDTEAHRCHEEYRTRRANQGKQNPSRTFTDPPDDPLLTGAVLGIAEHFLASANEEAAFEALHPLIQRSLDFNPLLSYYLRTTRPSSAPLHWTLYVDRRHGRRSTPPSRAEKIRERSGIIRPWHEWPVTERRTAISPDPEHAQPRESAR
ncbi:TniQ family protein [Streptomyces sioyaensis]|uniref:TniQ family protein n=1 Tax=Streptomyces sioyaensis TaxID=67364 RepID=UPI0037923607